MRRSKTPSLARDANSTLQGRAALVTGASGFVGQFLVRRLQREGARVVGWDRQTGMDLCDWDSVRRFRGPREMDVAFHLAALGYVPLAWEDPRAVFYANLVSTLHVLEFCRIRKVKTLVHISSYIYGKPEYLPIDESHPIQPANPYAWSKHVGEQLCFAYAQLYGLHIIIVRPFNIYGPGQNRNFLVPTILQQARQTEDVRLEDLKPRRDLLFVEDLVEALVRAGKRIGRGVEIFNLGAGKSYSVREVAAEIGRAAGKDLRLTSRRRTRRGEVMDVVADIRKAAKILHWRPAIDLPEGLARTWAEEERPADGKK